METCIYGKPRISYPKEKLKIARLPEIMNEIATASAGCVCVLDDRIGVDPVDAHVCAVFAEHVMNVVPRPLYIPFNVHRESRGLRDSKPEIQRDGARNATQADEDSPAVVHMVRSVEAVRDDGIFVNEDRYQCDYGGS